MFSLYNRGVSLLHSEFGVEGITNRRTLNQVMSPAHQLPVSLENPYVVPPGRLVAERKDASLCLRRHPGKCR